MSGGYGILETTFWTRGGGKKLRGHPEAQVVACYLFSAPLANVLGLYYLPLGSLCHDTGIPLEGVRAALVKIAEADIATYDEDTETVFVHTMARRRLYLAPGEVLKTGDRRVKGVRNVLRELPATRLLVNFWAAYKTVLQLEDAIPFKGVAATPLKGQNGDSGCVPSEGGTGSPPKPIQIRSDQGQDQTSPTEMQPPAPAPDPILTPEDPPAKPSRPRRARQHPLPSFDYPAVKAMQLWREIYGESRRRHGNGTYTEAPGDMTIMARIAKHAGKLAAQELRDLGMVRADTTELTETILRAWFIGYLLDDGDRNYLVEKLHALRYCERDCTKHIADGRAVVEAMRRRQAAPKPASADPPPTELPSAPPPELTATVTGLFAAPGGNA